MTRRLMGTAAMAAFVLAAQGGLCRAAGDVTAELVDGTLYVLGDKESNEVWVTGDLDTLTLTVAGDLTASFALDDVEAILVNTGGGNDLVRLEGTIPGDVMISTGAGWDMAGAFQATVLGDLSIESGQGDDNILVWSLTLNGSLDISTSHGADKISLMGSLVEVGGSLHVNTGVHKDHVRIDGFVTVEGDLLLQLGQGDDSLSLDGILPRPRLVVGGSASLHGDQGVDPIDRIYPLEDLIVVGEGLDIVGFE